MNRMLALMLLAASVAGAEEFRFGKYYTELQFSYEKQPEAIYTNAVMWLPFEYEWDASTNYLDASTYTNDGTQATANARPTFVAAVGQTNSARYDFDGVDDYIDTQISRGSDFSGSFTITAWAKRDAAGSWHVVMSDQLVAIGNASFEMRFRDTDIPSFAMRDSIGTFTTVDGTSTVGADSWVHLAGVYDAGVQKLIYVDGALIASNAQTSVQSATASAYVGVRPLSSAFPFNGQIDEPRIYNRALTTAEVAAIYDATVGSHP